MSGELIKTATDLTMQPWRVFGRFAIVYVLDGAGRYADQRGGDRPITAGDLIVVFPKLGHVYGPQPGQRWHEVYLVFEGPVFDLWERQGLLRQDRPVLHLEPVARWRQRLADVLAPAGLASTQEATAEVLRLQMVLGEMLAASDPELRGTERRWLAQARMLLEDDATSLEEVARLMHCSYATFRRRFTRLAGCAPARFRGRRRIERACDLMHRGELSDKQIAATLGFCDEFHFSRSFKQAVGQSPRAYRRSLP